MLTNKHLDLGVVKESNGVVKSSFTLNNSTVNTYNITDIKSSCGCSAVKSKNMEILPNSSINIEFTFNPVNKKGIINKSFNIYYECTKLKEKRSIIQTFKAEVI